MAAILSLGSRGVAQGNAPGGKGTWEVELAVVGHLSPAELWREAGLPGGVGGAIDPGQLRKRLEEMPLVESVEVQAPAGEGPVRFLVRERKPIAILVCPAAGVGIPGSDKSMVVDRNAVAVSVASFRGLEAELARLPRVQVLKIPGFAPGIPLDSPAVWSAVEVIGQCQAGSAIGVVREVVQTNDYSIGVDFEGGLRVQFSLDDVAGQVQKLRRLQSYAKEGNRRLKTVNLVLRRNIPVTFAEETAEENSQRDVQR